MSNIKVQNRIFNQFEKLVPDTGNTKRTKSTQRHGTHSCMYRYLSVDKVFVTIMIRDLRVIDLVEI